MRPLELGGAPGGIVVYSTPLRCHDDKRRFVTAMLLDGDGAPRGGGMVVAEAQGFAVSTRADELDLVVLRDHEIVVARARCR